MIIIERVKESVAKEKRIKVKAVYFDAGHTLVGAKPSLARYAFEVARKLKPGVKEEDFVSVAHLMEERFRRYLSNQEFHWSSRENIIKLWEDVYGYWMSLVGFSEAESQLLARKLYDRLGQADCWKVYPDVEETLAFFKEKNCHLGIISNWDDRLSEIIEQIGLGDYFSFILSSAQVGYGKPDERLFKEAVKNSGVDESFTLFVGDDPQADFYGAINAGMNACLIDREGKYPDFAGLRVRTLTALKEIVEF